MAESPLEAFKTAEAFGLFQGMLSGITGPRLVETIKAFHDTRKRYERLERAAKEDKFGRFAESKEIFDGLMAIKPYALALQEAFDNGEIPERVVHNDAKLSNILTIESDEIGRLQPLFLYPVFKALSGRLFEFLRSSPLRSSPVSSRHASFAVTKEFPDVVA